MSCVTSGSAPRFVVDGQAPMRQCLHPEACNKDINLPEHYTLFHDLRKEFVACYSTHGELSTFGIQEMMECILSQVLLKTKLFDFYVVFYIRPHNHLSWCSVPRDRCTAIGSNYFLLRSQGTKIFR